MEQQNNIRSELLKKLATKSESLNWGRVAEKLRKLEIYRDAATVFATPHGSLLQARINCLADGKNLLLPGPGIREGFFLLKSRTIPFKDISAAATYKGLEKYGQLLKKNNISKLQVDLLLTDSLIIDSAGGRVGDGNGFFDLSYAILQELDGLSLDTDILTFIQEEQISQGILPQNTWDIKMTGAITPKQVLHFESLNQKAKIFWDALPHERIKRIDPLWKLFQKKQGAKGKN